MRLIDADARVMVQSFDVEHEEYEHTEMSVEEALDFATDEVCPDVVDATPVVHGRWITNKYGETVCSECDNNALQILTGCLVNRHFEPHKSKFCPNCGARMDGDGA